MKKLRTLGATCVLSLMLAMPAFAGYIHTGVTEPQPPPPPASTPETANTGGLAGDISTGGSTPDVVTEAALNIIGSMLALF